MLFHLQHECYQHYRTALVNYRLSYPPTAIKDLLLEDDDPAVVEQIDVQARQKPYKPPKAKELRCASAHDMHTT